MSEVHHVRVLVAAVEPVKGRAVDALAKAAARAVQQSGTSLVRNVVVKGEPEYIQQLVSNVANDNEADVVILVGGAGIGPHDDVCDAIDAFVERRIEGFGAAYRRLFEGELGPRAVLVRATAGVYNQCVVFAMGGKAADVARAVQELVLPILPDAVDLATGRKRAP